MMDHIEMWIAVATAIAAAAWNVFKIGSFVAELRATVTSHISSDDEVHNALKRRAKKLGRRIDRLEKKVQQ